MTRFHILQWLNIVLVLANGLIFFWPKRLASGVPSNAAGSLALMAAVMIVVMLTHAILLGVALYQKKMTLLWVITFLIVPVSIWFWYFIFKFNRF